MDLPEPDFDEILEQTFLSWHAEESESGSATFTRGYGFPVSVETALKMEMELLTLMGRNARGFSGAEQRRAKRMHDILSEAHHRWNERHTKWRIATGLEKLAGEYQVSTSKRFALWGIKMPKPESVASMLGFFLPHRVREKVFKPFVEELREDRLLARKNAKNALEFTIIEFALWIRLVVTFLQSLATWASSIIGKLSPLLKWLAGGGG